MSKIRYLWNNRADSALLTPSSEISSLPAKNIQHPHRKLVWRTASDDLEWVEMNLGDNYTVKGVALINHNFYNSNLNVRLIGASLPYFVAGTYGNSTKGLWDWMLKDGTDRTGNLTALTPHGNTGTPTISWNGDSGMFGAQCHFDFSDAQYWDHADDDALDVGTGDFTLMGWVKITNDTLSREIMFKCESGTPDIGYYWVVGTTHQQMLCLYSNSGSVTLYSGDSIPINTYHFIAIVVDRTANQAKFFLDGAGDSSGWQDISAIGSATLSNTDPFYLGSDNGPGDYFKGYMGPMALIKAKLSGGQIATAAASPPFKESLTYDDEIIIKNFTGASCPYWRLEFNNPDNPDGKIDIGRVFLGDYFEPSRQFARNWEEILVDPSRIEQSEQGQEWVDQREKHRLIRVEFPEGAPLSEADRESYREMLQAVGCSKDLFIELDYDNKPNDWSLYGKFAQSEFNFREFLAGLFSTGFDFKESR